MLSDSESVTLSDDSFQDQKNCHCSRSVTITGVTVSERACNEFTVSDSWARLGSIEIQSRSSLDRGKFLTRYRSRRANFWVSFALKTLFAYTKDTLCVSKSLDTVSVSRSPTQISCIGNSLALESYGNHSTGSGWWLTFLLMWTKASVQPEGSPCMHLCMQFWFQFTSGTKVLSLNGTGSWARTLPRCALFT